MFLYVSTFVVISEFEKEADHQPITGLPIYLQWLRMLSYLFSFVWTRGGVKTGEEVFFWGGGVRIRGPLKSVPE